MQIPHHLHKEANTWNGLFTTANPSYWPCRGSYFWLCCRCVCIRLF